QKLGMVYQNPKNEDQWGYWERVPHMVPKKTTSISQKDQNDRLKKHLTQHGGTSVDSDDSHDPGL
ncbi:MAG: hypothetical protein ACREGR_01140, partial [Minisyncoccia bacterium]